MASMTRQYQSIDKCGRVTKARLSEKQHQLATSLSSSTMIRRAAIGAVHTGPMCLLPRCRRDRSKQPLPPSRACSAPLPYDFGEPVAVRRPKISQPRSSAFPYAPTWKHRGAEDHAELVLEPSISSTPDGRRRRSSSTTNWLCTTSAVIRFGRPKTSSARLTISMASRPRRTKAAGGHLICMGSRLGCLTDQILVSIIHGLWW